MVKKQTKKIVPKTIGLNPLEEYLAPKKLQKTDKQASAKKSSVIEEIEMPIIAATKKERITLHLSSDLLERIKNAVYWTPGLTIAGLAEEALAYAINKIERNNGEEFPSRREVKLRPGRPMK